MKHLHKDMADKNELLIPLFVSNNNKTRASEVEFHQIKASMEHK